MKKEILVIYYSQSGQLRTIIDSLFSLVQNECNIDYCEIKPVKKFPSPWNKHDFYDAMPECVLQIEEEIEPMSFPEKQYDLVVLGYQPWFLSPSLPTTSFLKSKYAKYLNGKNVITVIGSRNMWLNAQEKVKAALINLNATLVGNIAFFDRNPNLVSVLSIDRWSFKGQKEASTFLPEAGVQKRDIEQANRFGPIILKAINENNISSLHSNLLQAKSIEMRPALILLEKRAITNFRKFSKYIREKGGRGDENRKGRTTLFRKLLWVGIFILSPISSLTAKISAMVNKKSIDAEAEYFINISYKENAL